MLVEELKNSTEWEDFLKTSTEGTFFHSLKWREVIEKSFSYQAAYLTIRNANTTMVGICPGFILKSGPFRIYASLPHSDFGGPVINQNSVYEASHSLILFFKRYCSERGISYAKIWSTSDKLDRFLRSPLSYVDTSMGTMKIDLEATPSEYIWTKVFNQARAYRRKFKKYEREGLHVWQASTRSHLKKFYDLYCCNMNHIHARPHTFSFFENMWTLLFPENFSIIFVEKERTISGIAYFKYGDGIYGTYVAIDRNWSNISKYSVLPYTCWKLIKWAEENGFRHVHLGRTPSNPLDGQHIQKLSIGCSFVRQEGVYIPFSYDSEVFLLGLKWIASTWRIVKGILPTGFKNMIRTHAGEFIA
jgi:hypothetical protein